MLVHYTTEYPNPLAMRAKERTPVIRVLARDGSLIAERGSTHDFMPIDMLPQHVIDAVVATEDRRFFTHWGIDPAGMARAAFANLRAGRFAQGGSTLTQQLAKNLFLSSERTVGRKLDELALAIWLEVRLSKREILELYLNRVYFGGGAYGIEAASQRYFDKSARALNVAEAALIAGLLKAPSKYAPTASPSLARARGHVVLDKMREAGHLTDADHAKARRHKVQFAELKPQRTITGFEHAIDHVLDKLPALLGDGHGELIVETSIDPALQRRANEIVANALGHRGKAMGANEAALVALDREGGIRALVGGQSYEKSQFNRVTRARRQPGSAFKPFVYLTALEKGLTPDTVTYDLPLTIDGWSPRNESGTHAGALTLRQALAQSVNTVAVRLGMDFGIDAVAEMARRLGIRSEIRRDPSVALGTSEMTLLELTGAYGVFANGGFAVEPYVIRRVRLSSGRVLFARAMPAETRVVSEENVGAMNDMLNATMTSGTGRRAALPHHPAAGKTGTTQDFRDAWFIGYTAQMTLGVWVGNDDGTPMRRVMGGNLPAEMWRELMLDVHKNVEPMPLPGTSSPSRGPWPSSDTPVAATGAPETLPWRAPQQVSRVPEQSSAPSATARGQQAVAAQVRASSGRRIFVEPPSPGTAQRTLARSHPQEPINAEFLARVLATPPAAGATGLASASRGYDEERDRMRSETNGMMSLGVGDE